MNRVAVFRRRLRAEAVEEWGVPAWFAEAAFLAPFAGALLLLATAASRDLFVDVTAEDGILEWGQIAAWLVAIPCVLAMCWHLWRDDRRRGPAALYALLALAAMFVLAEELSWGQRLLDIDTPSSIRARNEQGETTVHNLSAIHGPYRVALFLAGAYGSLLVYVRGAWLSHHWREAFELYLPPLFLTSGFLLQAVYRGIRLAWLHEPKIYLWGFSEWPELLVPLSIAAFAFLNLRRHRLRGPSAASPSSPRAAGGAAATRENPSGPQPVSTCRSPHEPG